VNDLLGFSPFENLILQWFFGVNKYGTIFYNFTIKNIH